MRTATRDSHLMTIVCVFALVKLTMWFNTELLGGAGYLFCGKAFLNTHCKNVAFIR